MHLTDKQLLSIIIASKAEEGLLFADIPVYLTHSSPSNDLSTMGKMPFRFLMYNLNNSV